MQLFPEVPGKGEKEYTLGNLTEVTRAFLSLQVPLGRMGTQQAVGFDRGALPPQLARARHSTRWVAWSAGIDVGRASSPGASLPGLSAWAPALVQPRGGS